MSTTAFVVRITLVALYFCTWNGLASITKDNLSWSDADVAGVIDRLGKLRGRYMTNWNFFFQTSYFFTCVVFSLFGSVAAVSKLNKKLKPHMDNFFVSIMIPLAMYVAAIFWTLYLYDRELIFPKIVDKVMPLWINQALHSLIVPAVLLEGYLVPKKSPPLKPSLSLWTTMMIIYTVCIYGTYAQLGMWIYPIFGKAGRYGRILLTIILGIFSMFFFFVGRYVNDALYATSALWTAEKNKVKSDHHK